MVQTLGIDEAIARLFLTMLEPLMLLPRDHLTATEADRTSLNLVCEYIDANLGQPLHMEVLETVSGLSARSLQNYFKQRFQCSPTSWIATRRMQRAHQLLTNADVHTSVSRVALECGYSNFSLFAKRYSESHNELPSKTLSRAINK
jgi:AraC family transcriptional regulator